MASTKSETRTAPGRQRLEFLARGFLRAADAVRAASLSDHPTPDDPDGYEVAEHAFHRADVAADAAQKQLAEELEAAGLAGFALGDKLILNAGPCAPLADVDQWGADDGRFDLIAVVDLDRVQMPGAE